MEPIVFVLDQEGVSLPLSQVMQMHRLASELVRQRLAGDESAKQMLEVIFATALTHGAEGRGHAIISAYLVREALEAEQAWRAAMMQPVQQKATIEVPAEPSSPEGAPSASPPPPVVEVGLSTPCAAGHPDDVACELCSERFVHPAPKRRDKGVSAP